MSIRSISGKCVCITLLWCLLCGTNGAWSTPASTHIDNQASASFYNASNGERGDIHSNRVSATVAPLRHLKISPPITMNAAPGTVVYLPHRLQNIGNVNENVNLTITVTNANAHLQSLEAYRDNNSNGLIDIEDTLLSSASALYLTTKQVTNLLLVANISETATENQVIRITVTAISKNLRSRITDNIIVTLDDEPNIALTPERASVEANSELALDITFSPSGQRELEGTDITVDERLQKQVIVEVPLPAGVNLTRAPAAPEGIKVLYRIAGSGPNTYTSVFPVGQRVLSVAFARPTMKPGAVKSFRLFTEVSGETRTIPLRTNVTHKRGRHEGKLVYVDFKSRRPSTPNFEVNGQPVNPQEPTIVRNNTTLSLTMNCLHCDIDPNTHDIIGGDISSELSNDVHTFTLVEDENNPGVFISPPLIIANTEDETSPNDGIISAQRNDILTIRIYDQAGGFYSQILLVDPAGYVFDSRTGSQLSGVEVTLYHLTDNTVSLAKVFTDATGTTPSPNPTLTDSTGLYEFPFVAPGEYRVEITKINDRYSAPSKMTGAEMGDIALSYLDLTGYNDLNELANGVDITQAKGPSYGDSFHIENRPVFIDIPVDSEFVNGGDQPSSGLSIIMSSEQSTLQPGEATPVRVQISNLTSTEVNNIQGSIMLPFGFDASTTTVTHGAPPFSIAVTNQQANFDISNLAAEEQMEFTFLLIATPSALYSNGVVTGTATGYGRSTANIPSPVIRAPPSNLKIRINPGIFNQDAIVIGNVFYDCNENGIQDENDSERGIPDIRIYLQNGRYENTDSNGRFSFMSLRPSRYLLRLDHSMQTNEWRTTNRHQKIFNHHQQQIHLASGDFKVVHFPIQGCSLVVPQSTTKAPIQEPVNNSADEPTKSMVTILSPQNKEIVTQSQISINVSALSTLAIELRVNGEVIDDAKLGQTATQVQQNQKDLTYYAIALKTGENQIQVIGKDPWGNVRAEHHISVKRPGPFHQSRWVIPETLTADGELHNLELQLLDVHGLPIAEDMSASIWIHSNDETLPELNLIDSNARQSGIQTLIPKGYLHTQIRAPSVAGTAIVEIAFGKTTLEKELVYTPKKRDWIVMGQMEGELGRLQNKPNAKWDNTLFDNEESLQGLAHRHGATHFGIRNSLFAKGVVKEEYLVTVIADTDKRNEDDWRGRPNRERDYPRIGDDAVHGSEGDADKGLYLRVEKDESFFLIGNYRPNQDTRRVIAGAYNRKLYGAQHLYHNDHWQLETFAAQTNQSQIVDEFRAIGTSGPFPLSEQNILIGTERVEVVTKTRDPDGSVINIEVLRPSLDYDIDRVFGSILLRAPLASSNDFGQPRYLRVTYNVEEGFGASTDIAGADLHYRIHSNAVVGLRTANEHNAFSEYSLNSINSKVDINTNTVLIAEAANSQKNISGSDNSGSSVSVKLEHKTEEREITVNGITSSHEFENPSAAITPGSRDVNVHWVEKIDPKNTAWMTVQHHNNDVYKATNSTMEIGGVRTLSEQLKAGLSLEENHSELENQRHISETALGTQIQYQPKRFDSLTLEAKAYQSLSSSHQRQSINADYRLPQNGNMNVSWSQFKGYTANGDVSGNAAKQQRWTAGYRQSVHPTTEIYSQYHLDESSSGFDNSAATGLRFGYNIVEDMRLIAQAERFIDLSESEFYRSEKYSLSLGLSHYKEEHRKWTTRLEMSSGNDKKWLQEFRLVQRLEDGWNILFQERHQWQEHRGESKSDITSGLAYRPLVNSRWNWLGSYSYNRHKRPFIGDSSSFEHTRHTLRNAVHVDIHPDWSGSANIAIQKTDYSNSLHHHSLAALARFRLQHDINQNWTTAVRLSHLSDRHYQGGHKGWGVEIQRNIQSQFYIGLIYQKFDYENASIDSESVEREGWRFQFGGIFDENSLDGLLRRLD